MRGTDANTGKPLNGPDHLRQSVRDILTTPIGSRPILRDYGSRLFELIDKPVNLSLRMDLIAATVDALDAWEPRIAVDRVDVFIPRAGVAVIGVEAVDLESGSAVVVQGIEIR